MPAGDLLLEAMLKQRLLFGILMTLFFAVIVVFDGWLDGSLITSAANGRIPQGTIFSVLVAALIIPGQLELSRLAAAKDLKIHTPITMIGSVLFATAWYWLQLLNGSSSVYLFLLCGFMIPAMFLYQYVRYGVTGVMANCGVSCLAVVYLGVLSGFAVAVRVEFGVWPLLMFVFVVKSSDIGAYAIGSLVGRHKFSPVVSPGKTWEGMAGAVAAATIVAVVFAVCCDIITIAWWLAAVFGICFALIGQMGDLAESMMKRDAEQKDAANKVPGFGGVLDIVDSPLVAAPFAYLFFMIFG